MSEVQTPQMVDDAADMGVALVVLSSLGVRAEILDLLVRGDPMDGVPPLTLSKAIRAVLQSRDIK